MSYILIIILYIKYFIIIIKNIRGISYPPQRGGNICIVYIIMPRKCEITGSSWRKLQVILCMCRGNSKWSQVTR